MISGIIITILSLAVVTLLYVVYNLDKKLSIYSDWIVKYRSKVQVVYEELKIVDEKNLFEKDDDVGFVFSEIVRIITEFDAEIK